MATSLVLLISLHGPPSINEIYHKDDSFLSLVIPCASMKHLFLYLIPG